MSTLTAPTNKRTKLSPSIIHRIEIWPNVASGDPLGEATQRQAESLGAMCAAVRTARVYLVEGDITDEQIVRIRDRLLADPVLERAVVGSEPVEDGAQLVEVHPLPGVMDPVAQTVREAIGDLIGASDAEVVTGRRYDFAGISSKQADMLAKRLLANSVIESVHREPFIPESLPKAMPADQTLRHIEVTALDDAELEKLSREGHLFLSLEEMREIQAYYKGQGREPTDVELETLAQTWSEHCVHKTLKSTVRYTPPKDDIIDWSGRPGCEVQPDGSVIIHNLLKSTVIAATNELIEEGLDWTLSVFVDNAGIITFDDEHAICVKVETHNHPSAIDPYGGAATGVGGCIRDIMGTGLAAKPIANTDVFCVAMPDMKDEDVPEGCLHPKRILTRVVEGVRDYGNRMGIPTVNGAVHFDDRYVGNPLVFCGCVGIMPRDKVSGDPQAGDHIIVLGGRTGRDGIHGATFSSAELTETHADEFSHAVQIGNAIEEKRTLDAILRARDFVAGEGEALGTRHQASGEGSGIRHRASGESSDSDSQCPVPSAKCLFTAINDCGAGGFSSAVGEMGEELGAEVHLDRAPLKYAGLRYDEIWISESQERMVLAVPEENIAALQQICEEESVEMADLGTFGTANQELILHYEGTEVARLSMAFLHDGIPMPTREAISLTPSPSGRGPGRGAPDSFLSPSPSPSGTGVPPAIDATTPADIDVKSTLLDLLRNPNIASKRWIVRQYDHEVQGNTIIKPLVGPGGVGPGDATVIQPVPGSKKGLAIACGMATSIGDPKRGGDPYLMALAAVDECVRNLVCVGANPDKIAILDNFCWPSCDNPENMGALVRACMGCYDAAKAYGAPFISGKDSLNNQFRTKDGSLIEIPPTLLITGVAEVEDVGKCVTMDMKAAGNDEASEIIMVGPQLPSHLKGPFDKLQHRVRYVNESRRVGIDGCVLAAQSVHRLIQEGAVIAAHDCSEGGPLLAIAEMVIAASVKSIVSNAPLHSVVEKVRSFGRSRPVIPPNVGVSIDADGFLATDFDREDLDYYPRSAFVEMPGCYILQLDREWSSDEKQDRLWDLFETEHWSIGFVDQSGKLELTQYDAIENSRIELDVCATDLAAAFHSTLHW